MPERLYDEGDVNNELASDIGEGVVDDLILHYLYSEDLTLVRATVNRCTCTFEFIAKGSGNVKDSARDAFNYIRSVVERPCVVMVLNKSNREVVDYTFM